MQETQEMQVRSVGWKDPLAKKMATHSSILAWRIPRTEEPGGLHSIGGNSRKFFKSLKFSGTLNILKLLYKSFHSSFYSVCYNVTESILRIFSHYPSSIYTFYVISVFLQLMAFPASSEGACILSRLFQIFLS